MRKGAPGPRSREEQVSMAYAPRAYLGAGLNVAYGVRGFPPDGVNSSRLSCDGEKVSVAVEEEKPRASRSGVSRSGVPCRPNVPVDASLSGIHQPLWNIAF